MKEMAGFVIVLFAFLNAHPTYTAYSGATGSLGFCASSCHGSGAGTITLSGIPATYAPLTTYSFTVKHNGGSTISNFNASSRKGTTSVVAGSFLASTNSALYSVTNNESGVRASANSIDSAVFKWTAPAAGTGEVKIYLSGLQGSKSGATTKLIITTTEITTDIEKGKNILPSFVMKQNYPNPFNPTTTITYQLPKIDNVSLKIFDILGNEVATLVNEKKEAGNYSVSFDGTKLSTGIYFARLQSGGLVQIRKMLLVK